MKDTFISMFITCLH